MKLDALFAEADRCQNEIVTFLQELVRVPSVNTGVMPTGNETPVCQLIEKKLAADRIEAQIIESAPGRGNLTARLPGSKGSPRLLYMAHTDVVPVENEGDWLFPAFSGMLHNGRVYGRGAHDMKGTLAAEIMAMLILKRAGAKLAGDLMLAACADEEAGGAYGAGWLAKTNPELLQADYAINEGGGTPLKTPKGLAYFLNTGEKGRYEVHITAAGRSFHASEPWMADNPLYTMQAVLKRIQDYQPDIDTSHPMFAHLPALLGLPEPITNDNVDRLSDAIGAASPSRRSMMRARSRLTLVPTMISGGVKSNSIAERITLVCDIRSMPSQDTGYVQRELERLLSGLPGVSFELIRTAVPSASPADTPFADAVRRATALAIGRDDFAWAPGLTAGFTDSRLVRPLGVTVYDFAPAHPDADPNLYGAHNQNESQDVASLLVQTRMFLALAWDVLGAA